MWWFEIESNTQNSITVWSDLRTDKDDNVYVEVGDTFEIYDLHLKADSPCIDSGTKTGAPMFDKDGKYRTDNSAVANTGNGPPWIDQGAYEAGDGLDPLCGKPIPSTSDDHAYLVCEDQRTWDDASNYCSALGWDNAHLVTFDAADQNAFVQTLISDVSWIGAHEPNGEGSWQWETAETWGDYENWAEGRPYINPTYNCARMNIEPPQTGQWQDVPCDNTHHFICEIYR